MALLLAACGGDKAETPAAATARGVERAVADIKAAEAATRAPVLVSKSVGELTGKGQAGKGQAGAPAAKAGSAAAEETEAGEASG